MPSREICREATAPAVLGIAWGCLFIYNPIQYACQMMCRTVSWWGAFLLLAGAASGCHLIFPFESSTSDGAPDGALNRDATLGDAGKDGSRTRVLLRETFDKNTHSAKWIFNEKKDGSHHVVQNQRLELWTPSDAPPYYGETHGTRTLDALPSGKSPVMMVANFQWRGNLSSSNEPDGILTMGLVGQTSHSFQVFSSAGKLNVRFGNQVKSIQPWVWYRGTLTVANQVSLSISRRDSGASMLQAQAALPAKPLSFGSYQIQIETKNIPLGKVVVYLDDVSVLQGPVP